MRRFLRLVGPRRQAASRLDVTVQLPLLLVAERADVDSGQLVVVLDEFQLGARPLARQIQRQVLFTS